MVKISQLTENDLGDGPVGMPMGNKLIRLTGVGRCTTVGDTIPGAEIPDCIKRQNALNRSVSRSLLHACGPAASSSCCHNDWHLRLSHISFCFLEYQGSVIIKTWKETQMGSLNVSLLLS